MMLLDLISFLLEKDPFLKTDLNSVFHPDIFNLAGGKQVLHRD